MTISMNKTVLVFKAKISLKKEKLKNKVFGKRHSKLEDNSGLESSFDENSDTENHYKCSGDLEKPLIEIDFDQTD